MENKWINVVDKLPDTDRTVLAYMGVCAMTAHYNGTAWVQGDKGAGFPIVIKPRIEYWREWDDTYDYKTSVLDRLA